MVVLFCVAEHLERNCRCAGQGPVCSGLKPAVQGLHHAKPACTTGRPAAVLRAGLLGAWPGDCDGAQHVQP